MAKQISASDAKNNFGGLLEDVTALGRVDIVKHGRLVAIMLSPRVLGERLPRDVPVADDGRSAATHMIPAQKARDARLIGVLSSFDEE